MRNKLLIIFFCIVMLVVVIVPATACAETALSTSSKEAVLMSEDGQLLYEYNANEKPPIASMTKIMTLLRA